MVPATRRVCHRPCRCPRQSSGCRPDSERYRWDFRMSNGRSSARTMQGRVQPPRDGCAVVAKTPASTSSGTERSRQLLSSALPWLPARGVLAPARRRGVTQAGHSRRAHRGISGTAEARSGCRSRSAPARDLRVFFLCSALCRMRALHRRTGRVSRWRCPPLHGGRLRLPRPGHAGRTLEKRLTKQQSLHTLTVQLSLALRWRLRGGFSRLAGLQ